MVVKVAKAMVILPILEVSDDLIFFSCFFLMSGHGKDRTGRLFLPGLLHRLTLKKRLVHTLITIKVPIYLG